MKILLLSNIPTPYQLDFLTELSRVADVRAVFLWDREVNRDWNLGQKPWLRILKGGSQKANWEKLYDVMVDFKPEFVIVGGYRLPLSLRLRIFCAIRKISFHYWLEKPLPVTGLRKIIRQVYWAVTLPFAKSVFCVGNEAKDAYCFLSKKVLNLPYSVDSKRYFERNGIPNKPIRCLYIGQYIARKGLSELLQAFSNLKIDQASLTLVGSGELQDLVKNYALRYKNIAELGFVNPDQLPAVISRYDVLLAPSRHDGWAVVVVEAMLSGLPVVSTSKTGAFVQLISEANDTKIGKLCEVDADSIRDAVMEYVNNPEKVLTEGSAARITAIHSLAESRNAAKKLIDYLKN